MLDLLLTSDAVISECGKYRYRLQRKWDEGAVPAVFVMLNPSTADAFEDDPTIRKCMGFARRWGCGGIVVVNLFAFRATSPRDMKRSPDPVGPENWNHLEVACTTARDFAAPLVCAWGVDGKHLRQGDRFLSKCKYEWEARPKALRITVKTKAPEHPLYVPYDTEPVTL